VVHGRAQSKSTTDTSTVNANQSAGVRNPSNQSTHADTASPISDKHIT
jgi:hypothetical protein